MPKLRKLNTTSPLTRALTIIYRKVGDLCPHPRNPRTHDRAQIRQIASSIKAFGFNVPLLIDKDDVLIAGHGRWLAAIELGLEEVPTISLEHLTEAQARAFMIADNRLTETSVWDDRLLAEQLKELSELNLEFSLEATGFAMAEIDMRIAGLDDPAGEADPADAVPPLEEHAVSQPGDLWQLGRHLVCCGSALDDSAFTRLMGTHKAAMVFADPPYNVPIEGHASGLGSVHHREFAMASGEMDEAEFMGFLSRTCELHARYSHDGAIHFVCMDWRHAGELLAAAFPIYSELKNVCVWVKHNAGMGSLYRSQHELVFVFKHGKAPHRNNIRLGKHGRNRSNVWQYAGANSFGKEGNLLALHPTVKPVALVADAIRDCSARGDIILDGFLGSGTTLIAAERTGRRCHALEIDPLYVDTAIRRWQTLTGEKAHHATLRTSFDEIAAAKAGKGEG